MKRNTWKAFGRSICLVLLAVFAMGCAGSKMVASGRTLEHPVSLTRSIFGSDGRILTPSEKEKVGQFEFDVSQWSILYLIPLGNRQKDLSERLEQEIRSNDGDAIVNLRMTAKLPWYWYITSLMLIVPQDVTMKVEGDVVRLDEGLDEGVQS